MYGHGALSNAVTKILTVQFLKRALSTLQRVVLFARTQVSAVGHIHYERHTSHGSSTWGCGGVGPPHMRRFRTASSCQASHCKHHSSRRQRCKFISGHIPTWPQASEREAVSQPAVPLHRRGPVCQGQPHLASGSMEPGVLERFPWQRPIRLPGLQQRQDQLLALTGQPARMQQLEHVRPTVALLQGPRARRIMEGLGRKNAVRLVTCKLTAPNRAVGCKGKPGVRRASTESRMPASHAGSTYSWPLGTTTGSSPVSSWNRVTPTA